MKPRLIVATLAVLGAAAAHAVPEGDSVAVLELRSQLDEKDRGTIDAKALADRVRFAARLALPGARVFTREELGEPRDSSCNRACELQLAREAFADLFVTGELFHPGSLYQLVLELREVETGRLVGTARANGIGPDLPDAVSRAALELFRPVQSALGGLSSFLAPEPPMPALDPSPDAGADDDVLAAYEQARAAEGAGAADPGEAVSAWKAVAELREGNPFRAEARDRVYRWEAYAGAKRAFDEQLARDTDRLRDVLPQPWIAEQMKVGLLVRYARTYGTERASALVQLLPQRSREAGTLALGCEARQAASCVALARAAEAANDDLGAIEFLDRACASGSAAACGEAGDRWLLPATRDLDHAIAALKRGCDARSAASCVRLARVYEEGDGTKPDAMAAAKLRDQACVAGDGKSCRKLACTIDGDTVAENTRADELLRRGCAGGDARSCALLHPTAGAPAAAVASEKSEWPNRKFTGIALISMAAVAGAAALVMSHDGGHDDYGRSRYDLRRGLMEARTDPGGPSSSIVPIALGAGAVVSAITGILLISKSADPDKPRVGVSLAPNAVGVAGTMP